MVRLFHFSEDPDITLFRPRVSCTSPDAEPRVWAIDAAHAPSYWFPRECPRACCWRGNAVPGPAGLALLGMGAPERMHAIEAGWLERMRDCRLYAYEFDPDEFRPELPEAGYWTTRSSVRPVAVTPVGDLVNRHAEAGIELRIVRNLWPLIDAIVASGLEFSIIRKANAAPREA